MRIYGEKELGGLHVMYILREPASMYGLPERPRKPTERIFWRWVLGVIPGLALVGGIFRYLSSERTETAVKRGGEE